MKLAFYVNPVAGGWNPRAASDWGGGEEVAVCAAEAFARRNVDVTVFFNSNEPPLMAAFRHNGVRYQQHADAEKMRGDFDWAICFKSPEAGALHLAPRQAVWTDQERPFDANAFELVAPCSDFLRRCLASLLPQAEPKLHTIPYGYDPVIFPEAPPKDAQLVVHTGSPDRGLDTLLQLWPQVLEARPDTQLVITYGWDLFLKYGGSRSLKQQIDALLSVLPEDKVHMHRFSRNDHHAILQRAGIWAYFCTGGEFFGISAVKAQVARCVPVCRKWGALHETVWSGLSPRTESDMARDIIEALDPVRQEELRDSIDNSPAKTWDNIADIWLDIFEQVPQTDTTAPASHLIQVPPTPPLAVKARDNVATALGPGLAQWLGQLDSHRPWVSPTLPLNFNRPDVVLETISSAKEGDAVVIGWELESDEAAATTTLRQFELPAGTPTAVMVSYGEWRAKERRRYLKRQDLMDIVGQQPNCELRCIPFDNDGNGAWVALFKYDADKLGERNAKRARARLAPRESLSACFIVRDCEPLLLQALESVAPIADEIVLLETGSKDGTAQLIERFGRRDGMRFDYAIRTGDIAGDFYHDTRIPVRLYEGTSPRYCFDCQAEHGVGEFIVGHRLAGFETPRNESIAPARGDWILWLDSDEELLQWEQVPKYLRPNAFEGYALSQHHFSADPPQALKVDLPVRLFRRYGDGVPHWTNVNGFPTFHPGQRFRFAGVVHEHPGGPPDYIEGVNPVVVLSDVHAAHGGYLTEQARRKRFQRNWPLMVADHAKYPARVLGKFLWMRDLSHHMRYFMEQNNGQPTAECVPFAEEICRVWERTFSERSDPFAVDALGYVSIALQILGRGIDIEHRTVARKPEISGDEAVIIEFNGRVPSRECYERMVRARAGELERWEGKYSLAA